MKRRRRIRRLAQVSRHATRACADAVVRRRAGDEDCRTAELAADPTAPTDMQDSTGLHC